jgi:NAD(P)-dependent dehydrogenase (short-subunit alcohol dehydrogenase family)
VVEALADGDDAVMATARDASKLDGIFDPGSDRTLTHSLDLLDEASVKEAVDATLAAFGRIDVLLSAAGVGLTGSVEETSTEELTGLLDTNLIGTHRVIAAVLPTMRAQRSGHIAAISSQGAFQGQAGCAAYCASKAGVNALLEGLAVEVAPLGIGVTIIEPGLVDTDFRARSIAIAEGRIADYEQTCGALRDAVKAPMPAHAHDPAAVARSIVDGLNAPEPPLNLPFGDDALAMIRHKLKSVEGELDRWEGLSTSNSETINPGTAPRPGQG